jgi:hypothetical protein
MKTVYLNENEIIKSKWVSTMPEISSDGLRLP